MKVPLLPKSTLQEKSLSYAPFNVICQIIIHGIKWHNLLRYNRRFEWFSIIQIYARCQRMVQ